MTEADWLAAADPTSLLAFVKQKRHARKLRLFACGCCRRIAGVIPDECGHRAIELAERHADGEATAKELRSLSKVVALATADYEPTDEDDLGDWSADQALTATLNAIAAWEQTVYAAVCAAAAVTDQAAEQVAQCHLLRDIFNPFRPVAFDPAWRSETVAALAAGIYTDRAFDRLPILADAIEEAGCDQPDILNHCRGPGPHVRGCWAVDLVLGKE
jgi:hypothetical protein